MDYYRIFGVYERPEDFARHDYEVVFLKLAERLVSLSDRDLVGMRVLDVGCGYHAPNVALFGAAGASCAGADVQDVFYSSGVSATLRAKANELGAARAIRWMLGRRPWYTAYYKALGRESGTSVDSANLDLHTYDGVHMPFADGSFDAIASNAVLEHVMDMPALVDECSRVLAPGGVVDMLWHNFYCPSGGHLGERVWRANPWGHVTGELEVHALNKLLPDQIESAFDKRFEIVRIVAADRLHHLAGEDGFEREGIEQLTPGWRERLSEYPEELLVTRAFLLQGRRRQT